MANIQGFSINGDIIDFTKSAPGGDDIYSQDGSDIAFFALDVFGALPGKILCPPDSDLNNGHFISDWSKYKELSSKCSVWYNCQYACFAFGSYNISGINTNDLRKVELGIAPMETSSDEYDYYWEELRKDDSDNYLLDQDVEYFGIMTSVTNESTYKSWASIKNFAFAVRLTYGGSKRFFKQLPSQRVTIYTQFVG